MIGIGLGILGNLGGLCRQGKGSWKCIIIINNIINNNLSFKLIIIL